LRGEPILSLSPNEEAHRGLTEKQTRSDTINPYASIGIVGGSTSKQTYKACFCCCNSGNSCNSGMVADTDACGNRTDQDRRATFFSSATEA